MFRKGRDVYCFCMAYSFKEERDVYCSCMTYSFKEERDVYCSCMAYHVRKDRDLYCSRMAYRVHKGKGPLQFLHDIPCTDRKRTFTVPAWHTVYRKGRDLYSSCMA